MRRRALLAGLGCLAATAGCLADGDPAGNGTDPSANDGTPADDGESDADGPGDGDDPPSPDSFEATLEYPTYVLSMDEQFPAEGPTDVPSLAERNAATRAAVEAAIDGGFETDDPSEELLSGLHRLWYVEREGAVYDLSWSMPEYVLRATDVDASAVDPDRTAGAMDDRVRALGPDNRETSSAINGVVGRDGPDGTAYRATVLDEDLADYLETYDYVAYPDDSEDGPEPEGYAELSLEREDPEPPYEIEAVPVPDEERYGAAVAGVESFDRAVADALRRAAERREARFEAVPDGLAAATAAGYVRVEGDVYDPELVAVESDDAPASLSTSVDPDRRDVTLAVENEADGPISIFSGAPTPFGVLRAVGPDGEGATLWSDAYEESDHVRVDAGERGIAVNDVGLTTELEAGETVAETYEAREEWGFDAAGEYRVESRLSISRPDRDASSSVPFTLVLRIPGE